MLITHLKQSGASGTSQLSDLENFYRAAKKRFDEEPAFANEARQAVVRLQGGGAEELALWRRIVEESRRHYAAIYRRMDIRMSPADERGESFYNPMLADVVRELRDKGVAVESEGAIVVFVEGFEAPLIIQKRDGGFGYGTTDLAAVRFRSRELKAQRIIYVTDARQIQHFAQFFSAARCRLGRWRAARSCDIRHDFRPGWQALQDQGRREREAQGRARRGRAAGFRAGDREERRAARVTAPRHCALRRRGAIKYFDLARDRTGDYTFIWEKMLAMDGNTAPYMQYAYARIRSIFRKAPASAGASPDIVLNSPFEQALAKQILRLGEVLEVVGRELRPHHLCNYLYDLATRFSGFYENCPVIQSAEPLRSSRLALCDLTANAIALGLDLLGIEHPEQM